MHLKQEMRLWCIVYAPRRCTVKMWLEEGGGGGGKREREERGGGG